MLDDFRGTDEDLSALSELQSDVNQQYTQQRYQMIGDVMRNELPDAILPDFAPEAFPVGMGGIQINKDQFKSIAGIGGRF